MTASAANAWGQSPVVTDYDAVEHFGANGKDYGFGESITKEKVSPNGISTSKVVSYSSTTFDDDDVGALGHFGSAVGLGGLGSLGSLNSVFGDLGSNLYGPSAAAKAASAASTTSGAESVISDIFKGFGGSSGIGNLGMSGGFGLGHKRSLGGDIHDRIRSRHAVRRSPNYMRKDPVTIVRSQRKPAAPHYVREPTRQYGYGGYRAAPAPVKRVYREEPVYKSKPAPSPYRGYRSYGGYRGGYTAPSKPVRSPYSGYARPSSPSRPQRPTRYGGYSSHSYRSAPAPAPRKSYYRSSYQPRNRW